MKLQSKWLWAPALATAIVLLPATDGLAQRGRDGGDGRGACAPESDAVTAVTPINERVIRRRVMTHLHPAGSTRV